MDLAAGADVVEVFPLEVWGEIFSYLSPADKISCYNATREWKDLLASKRTTFMMPKVFPLISGYLKEQDVLNSRRVCRVWKNGVDDFLQTHPIHYNEIIGVHDHSHFHCPYGMRAQFRPAYLAKLERYLERGDGQPEYNPFAMSRTVVYRERESIQAHQVAQEAERNQDQTLRLRAAFPKFLTLFGSEMWHCWLIFTDEETTRETIYTIAQTYLTRMPNLKTLSIGVLESNFSGEPRLRPEIGKLVKANPLPELKNLVKLSMDSVPNPLENEMLSKNRHLKKLFWKSNTSYNTHDADVGNEMRQLEVLRLCPLTDVNISRLNLPSSASQLKELDLFVKNQDLGYVFRAVSRFCQSLKYFGLEFFGEIPEDFNENLMLPLVETVKINAQFSKLKNIDFLMTCTSLKHLETAVASSMFQNWRPDVILPWASLKEVEAQFEISPMSDRVRSGVPNMNGVIQFDGCKDFLYGSNIWGLLPKLELCKIFVRSDFIIDMRIEGVRCALVNTHFARFVYTKKGYFEFLEKTRHTQFV